MNGTNNINELYTLLLPALRSKVNDLKYQYIDYIEELDIWNYLKKEVWSNELHLYLCDLVNDILNIDKEILKNYYNKGGL